MPGSGGGCSSGCGTPSCSSPPSASPSPAAHQLRVAPLSAASSSNWNQWNRHHVGHLFADAVDHRLDLRHAADHPLARAAHAVEGPAQTLDVGGAQTGEARRFDGEQGDGGDQGQGQAPAVDAADRQPRRRHRYTGDPRQRLDQQRAGLRPPRQPAAQRRPRRHLALGDAVAGEERGEAAAALEHAAEEGNREVDRRRHQARQRDAAPEQCGQGEAGCQRGEGAAPGGGGGGQRVGPGWAAPPAAGRRPRCAAPRPAPPRRAPPQAAASGPTSTASGATRRPRGSDRGRRRGDGGHRPPPPRGSPATAAAARAPVRPTRWPTPTTPPGAARRRGPADSGTARGTRAAGAALGVFIGTSQTKLHRRDRQTMTGSYVMRRAPAVDCLSRWSRQPPIPTRLQLAELRQAECG